MNKGRFIVTLVTTLVFFPAVILFVAGDWHWLEGWLFGIWMDVMVLSSLIYMYAKDPALLAERSRLPGSGNQRSWDKYLLIVIYILAVFWFVIMPLDAKRLRWSPPFPLWLKVVGGLLLLPALFLIYRATVENTFLSTLVRIQSDRGQRVISTGLYGFVRHPLYLGTLLMLVAAPLLLGSVAGLVVSLIAVFVLVGRIIGEERMLLSELKGYDDYKRRVTSRLLPFIW
jgi:protein-S-isoprenylcysteine O-methyltransferase Ste14